MFTTGRETAPAPVRLDSNDTAGSEAGSKIEFFKQCPLDRPRISEAAWLRQTTPDLVVRTAGDPKALAATLRAVVRSLDSSAILSPVTTLEQQLSGQLSPRRFQMFLLTLFASIALLLACVGMYGVVHLRSGLGGGGTE